MHTILNCLKLFLANSGQFVEAQISYLKIIASIASPVCLLPPPSQALDLVLLPLSKHLQLVFLHVGPFSVVTSKKQQNLERRSQKHTSMQSILKTKVASNKYVRHSRKIDPD